jgi:hypothetical protein
MKKIILFVILVLFALIVCVPFNLSSQNLFEGKITYQVSLKLKQENHPYNVYFKQKFGDTVVVYINKDGSQKRTYKGSGELGLDWSIYDRKENQYYSKWHSMDSIFYYDCDSTITKLDKIYQGKSETILGDKCKALVVESYESRGDEKIKQTFYYCGKEKVDKNAYSDFKDGYLDKVYKKSKSHLRKWVFEQKFIIVTFEAIKIEWENVDKTTFKISKGIIKIKQ